MKFTIQLRDCNLMTAGKMIDALNEGARATNALMAIVSMVWPDGVLSLESDHTILSGVIGMLKIHGFDPNQRPKQAQIRGFSMGTKPSAGTTLKKFPDGSLRMVQDELLNHRQTFGQPTPQVSKEWENLQRQWLGKDLQVVAQTKPSAGVQGPQNQAQRHNQLVHGMQKMAKALNQFPRTTTKEKTNNQPQPGKPFLPSHIPGLQGLIEKEVNRLVGNSPGKGRYPQGGMPQAVSGDEGGEDDDEEDPGE